MCSSVNVGFVVFWSSLFVILVLVSWFVSFFVNILRVFVMFVLKMQSLLWFVVSLRLQPVHFLSIIELNEFSGVECVQCLIEICVGLILRFLVPKVIFSFIGVASHFLFGLFIGWWVPV